MPFEITMPQLSDTMAEGTLVKWNKKEGDKITAGQEIADIETDKAVMPLESFEGGTIAFIAAPAGTKVKVGGLIGVIALAGEKAEDLKKKYASAASAASAASTPAPAKPAAVAAPKAAPAPVRVPPPAAVTQPAATQPAAYYNYDIAVLGGGPAGYAAAIRAGQLGKRVVCVERENLGGTCLNWGCIPTKALLESGAFVRKMRTEAGEWGVSFDNFKVDFNKIISRSRGIADKLSKGIAHLLNKYKVKHEKGTASVVAKNKVRVTAADGKTSEFTAQHIVLATGARSRTLPGAEFDGKVIISSREAMILPNLPKRMAVIGAGAIGCEFADFYNSLGTEVTVIEMMDHLLPIEDDDVSIALERSFAKRGIAIHTKTKTDKVEKTAGGVKVFATGPKGPVVIEADVLLVAIGVLGNIEGVVDPSLGVETFKGAFKTDEHYRTTAPGIYAVGDVAGPPWLAHVAHHEAVLCIEEICGQHVHAINYDQIPGCTYTHPQVASMGLTERKAREEGRQIRIGKFPFSASGRALAAGESEGFVKLLFDAKYGQLVGVHMIGENVTELLSELVMAGKLEATEQEILAAMHPHPTLSEAVMEAAGVSVGKAIHL